MKQRGGFGGTLAALGLKLTGVCLAAGVSLAAGVCLGQPSVPAADDFQVNTYTTDSQFAPAAAASPSGEWAAVWMSRGSSGDDTSQYSIQGRRYDNTGVPSADDFQVNGYTTGDQQWPAVAMAGDAGLMVVWASRGSGGTDDALDSIQGRRFDAAGVPLGNDFQVNTTTGGQQSYPAVAAAIDGRFVVVWQSQSSAADDDQGYSVQGQLYANDGMPVGGELQLNQHTPLDQGRPAVAMASDGAFLVVWESASSPADDTSFGSIQGRRFDSLGAPQGDQFQVNQRTLGNQSQPRVALASDGQVTVVWKGLDTNDDEAGGIVARRFSASDVPRGGEFQVNSFTTGDQLVPDVDLDADGDLVIVWESVYSDGGDNFRSIQGRRFTSRGETLGPQMLINSFTAEAQFLPAVASRGEGDFVVTWNSLQSPADDSSSSSVLARLYVADSDGDGIADDDDLCLGSNGSGDIDGDGICADLDCDDDDGDLGLPDLCGVCGGDGSTGCALWRDGFEKGDASAWSTSMG